MRHSRARVDAEEIHDAARRGDLARVEQQLNNGVDVNLADNGGYTALILAARNGHSDIIQLLIKRGC